MPIPSCSAIVSHFARFDWSAIDPPRKRGPGYPAHPKSAYLKAALVRISEHHLTTPRRRAYQFEHTYGYRAQRFCCPLLFPEPTGQGCDHEQFAKGTGCVKDVNWERGD